MKRKSEAGAVLPLVAIGLAVLMGFAALAVDVGYLEYRGQMQQTATDAAASGGARALIKAGCPNPSAAQAAAVANATNNGFTNGAGGVTVTTVNPPTSGPFANNTCAVLAMIKTNQVATFFSRIFGFQGMDESTQAVAIVSSNGAGCIYLLSMTVATNFNGGTVNASQCGILINDTANMSNSTINALNIGYAGVTPNENGAHFGEALPGPMLPIADPCPEITGCAYLAANPPSTSSCSPYNLNQGTGTIGPGCYSSISVNKSTLTLQGPGIFVFNGATSFSLSTIIANNATIYVTANGTPPNFNGDNVTLSPPTSGNSVGVAYYQVPANTQNPNLNGNNDTYSGLIYCPTCTVNYNGSNGGYLVLVFGAINFNANTAQDFATPPPEQALIKTAVVAQ